MPSTLRTIALVIAAAATAVVGPLALGQAKAEPAGFEQKGVHVHGKVTVNLALDGNTLTAELDAPAINVIGFERAPRDDAERRVVAEARSWLESGAAILGVPAAAGCSLSRAEAKTPDWAKAKADGHDHSHDHSHDHAHDHSHDHGGGKDGGHDHADYEARFVYDCRNPAALAWSELWVLRRLKDVTEADVNIVTATLQTQKTLAAGELRVALR